MIEIPLLSFSQVEKPITRSTFLIGGSASAGFYTGVYETGGTSSNLSINFTPSAGYFIMDGLAIGLAPRVYFYLSDNSTFTTLGLSPFAKYYFQNGFVVRLDIGYSFSTGESYSNSSLGFGGGLGYAYFLNSNVALELFLNEYINVNESSSNSVSNSLYFSLGLQAFL